MLNVGCIIAMCGSLSAEVLHSERWEWIARKIEAKGLICNDVKDLSP